jgi:hypothetical protein
MICHMSRGVASAAARRSTAPRPRPETTARPPARQPPAAVPAGPARGVVPTARERLQASFGRGPEPIGPAAAAPALAPVPAAAMAVTTRDRIVNRALAAPPRGSAAPEPTGAVVVDLAEFRERRAQPEPRPLPTRPTARGPPAPVVELKPKPKPKSEEPERGEAAAGEAPAAALPTAAAAPPAAAAAAQPAGEAAPTAEGEAAPAAPEPAEPQAAADGAEPTAAAAAGPPAAPAAPAVIRNPEDEPGFQAMKERTQRAAVRTKRHQTGQEASDIAQGASAPNPELDVSSQAAAERVGTMAGTEPGEFDPEDFKTKVKAAIEGMAPPANLEEADEFEESGKAEGARSTIEQLVLGGRDASQREIKDESTKPPTPEGKKPKEVSDMVDDRAGPPLPPVGAAEALPGRRPPEQSDVSFGPLQVEAKLIEANVTEEQLADANEPEFSGALDARREVREHAEQDPVDYRIQEGLLLERGRAEVEGFAAAQLEGMHGARVETLGKVAGAKDETKSADQLAREEVHAGLLDIHTRTADDVKSILETLDSTVDTIFTSGEQAARESFEAYVATKMREYKADRYSGIGGGILWAKDKLFDLPDEVNDFYRDGRADYLAAMDRVIELIATIVGLLLGAAKLRIEAGREEVRAFNAGLDDSLRTLGEETAADLDNRFDQLDADVDAKGDELVDTVARKYVESRDGLDERIKELQEANKGLVSKAIDAIVGVLKTIYELGKLLLRVLLKAAAAIGDIIAHPIRFLENLVDGVKGGLDRFVERIDVHLQKSLLDLLFGELGSANLTMPAQLDFAGILDLVLQVLGLTYASVRERVVKRFGEPVVAEMEEKVDIFRTLARDGLAGVWTWIQAKLADLEDLVIGKIKEFVKERVIKAGISYIVALLNPAAAFIKACQGIYQIVMFIVERAKQIAAFVEAILDSIGAIAQGNVGVAVEKVESALANGLSLAIAFLARLANLGGLSDKVRSIIALVRRPITRVVDQVVLGAAAVYRRTLGPAIAFGKAKVQSGKEFLKGKSQAVKDRIVRGPELAEAAPPEQAPDGPEAPAAEPVQDPGAAGPLVIHEPFRIEGHEHELYTGEDGKQLILASNGATPITALGDAALDRLHAQYVAARGTYDNALAQLAANPRARPGIGAARARINTIIGQIVARIRQLRPDDSPGASAPGIGDKGRHGEKRTSLRFGPPLWHLESEHVMPFAVGKLLWDAAGELIPRRGRAADRRQTTIMIYEGAARFKTDRHDEALWTEFRGQYNANLRPTVRSLQLQLMRARVSGRGSVSGFLRGQVEELLARLKRGLLIAAASSVEATQDAVRDEHAETDGGGPTHGARRAEPSPVPAGSRIQTTAAEQFNDVYALVSDDVESAIG